MEKSERILIALFLSVACPTSLFILCWWAVAAMAICRLCSIPEGWIAGSGFAGLGVGVMLVIFFLKKWTQHFYSYRTTFLISVYLFWSAIAVALLMGLPFLNLALGALAGLYVGRRHRHLSTPVTGFARTAKNIGLFTALVTGLETLFIGLFALREESVAGILRSLTGRSRSVALAPGAIAMVVALALALMAIQYWLTRTAANFAFRIDATVQAQDNNCQMSA